MHGFEDVTDARAKLQVWKQEDNEERPHRALKNLTPLQDKAQWHIQRSENRYSRGLKIGVPSIRSFRHFRCGPKLGEDQIGDRSFKPHTHFSALTMTGHSNEENKMSQ